MKQKLQKKESWCEPEETHTYGKKIRLLEYTLSGVVIGLAIFIVLIVPVVAGIGG